ncbi:hypothetical protein F511_12912 [Dorcoceras hygrometricum]|uniref:Uncharacterized protein n=1 Tax=Dorcoceras hygrometricum TaxID=472368 RepID=A0A2Z7CLJ9_9LAMI|nr:hypothetical protein F511_12912 [Dorcoceras hygrometricum]
MRIRPPELETSICDAKSCFIGMEHCDVLSMQIDSDLVIYRTTLVRIFQVVTICRVDKSEVLVVLISPHDSKHSIGYPCTKASGESSTTKHRLLHASGPHPIPPPNDPNRVAYWISASIQPMGFTYNHLLVYQPFLYQPLVFQMLDKSGDEVFRNCNQPLRHKGSYIKRSAGAYFQELKLSTGAYFQMFKSSAGVQTMKRFKFDQILKFEKIDGHNRIVQIAWNLGDAYFQELKLSTGAYFQMFKSSAGVQTMKRFKFDQILKFEKIDGHNRIVQIAWNLGDKIGTILGK